MCKMYGLILFLSAFLSHIIVGRGESLPWSCGFESAADPLCGMTQSLSDNFNWTVYSGSTPSNPTGPCVASTGLYFAYIEVTGEPPSANASLVLPSFDGSPTQLCVSFVAHMYGYHINELRLVHMQNNQDQVIWNMVGEVGDFWFDVAVDIPSFSATDMLAFTAVRGDDYTGDIALDNIRVTNESCPSAPPIPIHQAPTTTTTPPPTTTPPQPLQDVLQPVINPNIVAVPWTCGFESDTNPLCDMIQSDVDEFDWLVNETTPSYPTGPDAASSGQFFAYIEASNPRVAGDTAVLVLPEFDQLSGDSVCITFDAHMHGHHVDEIALVQQKSSGNELAWSKSGHQGNYWFQASANVTSMAETTSLSFVGVRGGEFSGDIALDNIRVTDGACASSPDVITLLPWKCDFEFVINTLCGMEQAQDDDFDWTVTRTSTPSFDTGPSVAGSGVTYVFIETSSPRSFDDAAVLYLPRLYAAATQGPVCVSFQAHMYGASIAELKLVTLHADGSKMVLWRETGEHGDFWFHVNVTVDSLTDVEKIAFVGVRGEGNEGDIALDDVAITDGSCLSAAVP